MYYVDSLTQRLDRFDFDLASGAVANRRTLATIASADGSPDGLAVDAEGAIWLALWGGSSLRRYLPDGTLDRVLPVPVTYPTTCAFGGPDLGDLFITSATIKMTAEERRRQPLAGSILRCRPGVAGKPACTYRVTRQWPPRPARPLVTARRALSGGRGDAGAPGGSRAFPAPPHAGCLSGPRSPSK